MPAKEPDNEEKQTYYVCPYCEKAFKTKNALNGHLGVCKARPADDDDGVEDEDSEGIDLFPKREEGKPASRRREVQDDEDGYQCGACGYVSSREFRYCPKCGEENDFE